MQVNLSASSCNSQMYNQNPNFGMVYKKFPRAEFKNVSSELENRVGIHVLKGLDDVKVVFATVPNSLEETDALQKYNAQSIKPKEAKEILGYAVSFVTENFGKFKSEIKKPLFDTTQGMTPYTRKTRVSKSRIDGFINNPNESKNN